MLLTSDRRGFLAVLLEEEEYAKQAEETRALGDCSLQAILDLANLWLIQMLMLSGPLKLITLGCKVHP